jgi:predicted small lipoprotein YifL
MAFGRNVEAEDSRSGWQVAGDGRTPPLMFPDSNQTSTPIPEFAKKEEKEKEKVEQT